MIKIVVALVVSIAEIGSFALNAAIAEEIYSFAVEHSTNYRDTVMYFVESFPVNVFCTAVTIDALVETLATILNADPDLEVYFDAPHCDGVAFENPVRCHAPANDCNLSDLVTLAVFSGDAYCMAAAVQQTHSMGMLIVVQMAVDNDDPYQTFRVID